MPPSGWPNLVHVLDPEVVVIAGGLIDIGEPLVRGIEAWTHRYVLGGDQRRRVQVVAAGTGKSRRRDRRRAAGRRPLMIGADATGGAAVAELTGQR